MTFNDTLIFASGSLRGARSRTLLMILAMSIGVAAVVVLTALGEGARRYVVNQFSSLGTNLVIVLPGRSETAGVNPGMLLGQTARDIVLDDVRAVLRSPAVRRIAPLTIGAAQASNGARNREVVVAGTNSDFLPIRHMDMGQGQFLPPWIRIRRCRCACSAPRSSRNCSVRARRWASGCVSATGASG